MSDFKEWLDEAGSEVFRVTGHQIPEFPEWDFEGAFNAGAPPQRAAMEMIFSDVSNVKTVQVPKTCDGLVGLFGHRRDNDGEIQNQFSIDKVLSDALCLIQLYSYIDGRPTNVEVLQISQLSDTKKFSLYTTEEEWRYQNDRENALKYPDIYDGPSSEWGRKWL